MNVTFKNRYLALGEGFYHSTKPTPVARPGLIRFNYELAAKLGMSGDALDDQFLADVFSGNRLHDSCRPLAMAYAGHQFGHFNPELGDGRAIYLGELDHVDGGSMDIQLKGSGPTRYSRSGDGRAALGPVLREYLVSEAMHALNVPTTRALAAVTTGEQVVREKLLPGGVITRAAASFIRVGSFQYFAMQENLPALQALADYVIERNYPEVKDADNPCLALFEAVAIRQADLIARWMQLGFIHGVMNTDNMSMAGETIDYGPCAFMDFYKHGQWYSYVDRQGRYAYANQPDMGVWNLSRLAEALLPLFAEGTDEGVALAQAGLQKYVNRYGNQWLAGFRAKCGLSEEAGVKPEDDKALIESLLDTMADNQADFTLTFHYLSRINAQAEENLDDNERSLRDLFINREDLDAWLARWRERLTRESASDVERQARMQSVNPVYIPRNHQVEAVIRAAEDHNDFAPFQALCEVLQKPFEEQPGKEAYMQPPLPDEVVLQTFCGT